MTHTNREAWLHAFADAARPHFAAAGHPLPATLRIGVGWTSGGARAANKVIGECYHPSHASDGVRSIIISTGAGLPDAEAVAAVLTHELAHAALAAGVGHKAPFAKLVRALGLDGPAVATVAGDAWRAWAGPVLAALGDYPHSTLTAGETGKKKQSTRMLKIECPTPGCGMLFRGSRTVVDRGLPKCPVCDARMTCEGVEGGEEEGEGDEGLAIAANTAALVTSLVAAVRKHAEANYERGGWDILVECWSDEEIAEEIGEARTVAGAVRAVGKTIKLLGDHRREIQATAW